MSAIKEANTLKVDKTKITTNMRLIQSGEFLMGSNSGSAAEEPIHSVYLDSYYIDITPVTNTQFSEFVTETGYITIAEKQLSRSWKDCATAERENHPVVYISWWDALAYAKWANKRLPTEAEWEKAAHGGIDGSIYPWGNVSANETHANWNRLHVNPEDLPPTTCVKQFPPNNYGLYDMSGNVWEWCSDWYEENYYSLTPKSNPYGPLEGTYRVRRGASWNIREAFRMRCTNRGAMLAEQYWPNLGFRCAVSIDSL